MALILVADDDPLLRRTLTDILGSAFDVIEASDGDEAVRLCVERRPDVAVLDLVMPRLDGLDAIRKIRAECPGIRIVAVSGGGRNRYLDILAVADQLGADAVLPKPFSPRQLLLLLNEQLGEEWAVEVPGAGKKAS
jgi:CheY-like chemotaxis protein